MCSAGELMSQCQYCSEGHSPVELCGLWVHQFSSRWITCVPQPAQTAGTAAVQAPKSPANTADDLAVIAS